MTPNLRAHADAGARRDEPPGGAHDEPAEAESRPRASDRQHDALEAALREAHERARDAERAKSDFLATMSHEMRTPLNAVLGYSELLGLEVAGPLTGDQRDYLERIRSASSRLLSLVDDVLNIAKIDAGRMVLAAERGSAAVVIARAVEANAVAAAAREVTVTARCDDAPDFLGDARRAQQIVAQLVANAIRFTPRGGAVTVTCTRFGTPDVAVAAPNVHRCWCAIRVADTGIGIAKRHLETIFEPFTQVEQTRTRRNEGSGLGLALGRRLARLMGGDLTVTSKPDDGSAFTLWLPAPPSLVGDASDAEGCETAERRGELRTATGLIEVADALLRDMDGLLDAFVARMRDDPIVGGGAADQREPILEDHTATFLTDVAQALCVIEESGGGPSPILRDGRDIQHVIADRHARLRQTLGWTEREMDREYDILVEVIEERVRAVLGGERTEAGLGLIRGFVDRAREAGRASYRQAAMGSAPPPVA
ncbi:MAG TPA: HAMP domain-containing sensor histidine kinase [Gemmatimonadaceae bacterium]|nr:HAMP domain-containing sensor histidine kinase [Gemmatimonadaceae bacterium]